MEVGYAITSLRRRTAVVMGLWACLGATVFAYLLGCGGGWDREDAPPPGRPTAPPDWVEHGEHDEYPAPRYLTALGSSNVSPRQAHERARAQVRRALREEVREAVAVLFAEEEQPQASAATEVEGSGSTAEEALDERVEGQDDSGESVGASAAPVDVAGEAEAASPIVDPVAGVTEILLASLVPSEADERLRDHVRTTPPIPPIELGRKAYYSDGFTFYSLWGIDREQLAGRSAALPVPLVDVDPNEPEELASLVRLAAAELAAWMASHPPGSSSPNRGEAQEATPAVYRLAELWSEAALATSTMGLDGESTVRLRRLEPRTVEVILSLEGASPEETVEPALARFLPEGSSTSLGAAALEEAPLTLYALGRGCPSEVHITDHGPSLSSELPVRHLDREPAAADEQLGHAASYATEGLALTPPTTRQAIRLQVAVTVQPALADRGTLWLVADRLPEGFAPWRHTFPVASHRLDFALPHLERLRWQADLTAELGGAVMERKALAPLVAALLIEAGHDELSERRYDPQANDNVAELAADEFLVVLRGHVEVRYDEAEERPLASGELRIVAEDIREPDAEGRTDVELAMIELAGRGYPSSKGPFPALRDALSRSRVQTTIRQALDRFTR